MERGGAEISVFFPGKTLYITCNTVTTETSKVNARYREGARSLL
jgi:hypothetical protein